jgi:hypothetical protein
LQVFSAIAERSFTVSDVSKHPLEGNLSQEELDTLMTMQTGAEISAYMHELELSHGLRVRDEYNPERLHEVVQEAEVAPKFSIKIGDEVFTADTTEELAAKSEAALVARVQKTQADAAAAAGDQARNKNGTFRAQPRVTDDADEITNDIVTKALQARGIDMDALKEASDGKRYEKSWAEAAGEWIATQTPESYPGGEQLKEQVAVKIRELGLEGQPSAASIQKAYDLVVAEAEQYLKLQKATSSAEIQEIIGKTARENDARRYRR